MKSWEEYCKSIDIPKRTANDWLLRAFGESKESTEDIKEPKTTKAEWDLLEGNCLDILPTLKEKSIDLCYADPPYYRTEEEWDQFKDINEYLSFTKEWIQKVIPLLKEEYHFFINFSSEYFADLEIICRELKLPIRSRIIWRHGNMSEGKQITNQFGRIYDPILHIGNKELNLPQKWGNERFDVWDFAIPQTNFEDKKIHKTQKPIELIKRIVELGSDNDSRILDPFAGSGTTGIVCWELNRDFTLIEQNPDFIKLIKDKRGIQ